MPHPNDLTAITDEETIVESDLSAGDVRSMALEGVAVIGLRGVVIRMLGFAGNIALARLLAPKDFGILAFGQVFVTFASFMADAGLVAGLMSRREPPDDRDLSSALGFQLLVTTVVAALGAVIAIPFGQIAEVTAVMLAALPFGVLRTPTTLLFERGLQYSQLAYAEVAEVVAYVTWSVATVLLGAGVWGVATGVVVRSAVGSALLLRRSPVRHLRPRLEWSRVRGLLGFGARIQATGLVGLVRDQGLNLATAAIAGLPVLGFWGLVQRIMLMPLTFFEGLWRVSFPAIARLSRGGTDPAQDIERALSMGTIATGAIVVALGASAPASVPVVFGSRWAGAADAVPPCCLALLISGPIAAPGVGYLYAHGRAGRVLVATTLYSIAWVGVALLLLALTSLGAASLGWGWLAASIVDALLIGSALAAVGVRVIRSTAVPVLAAALTGGAGLAFALSAPATIWTALAAAAGSSAIYASVLLALVPRSVRQAIWAGKRALRGLRRS
ncbi:MAG: oligosaccharide flippase family protein [Solirubrobacterales bacterium]|nr:oligosaccharide flippase family protein [Solirubrobacterales bacterium]